jgi:hypothetical protein
MSDYFNENKPFAARKAKKSEFPDAFNLSMLRAYAAHNAPVIIVSGDNDFSDEKGICRFESLERLLDAINSQDEATREITRNAKEYIASNQQLVFDKIESEVLDKGYTLEVDGTDTDRDGISNGYEYDEVELLSFTPVALSDVEIIDIAYPEKFFVASAQCKAKLEFECMFFDEEHSTWNSEDKEYVSSYYGTMREVHNVIIPVESTISFEEDMAFEVDYVDIDMNIELNQYTLQKDGRTRTDNPYSYSEDLEINNPCPDCGRGMTFETEGGNGFCIICAQNH